MSSKYTLLMESYFDFLYAKSLSEVLGIVVKEQCYGCQVDHPSQKHHPCIMDDEEDHVMMYFHHLVEKIDEQTILSVWCDFINQLDIPKELMDIQKQKMYSEGWLQTLKTDKWEDKIIKLILTTLRCERRLFN